MLLFCPHSASFTPDCDCFVIVPVAFSTPCVLRLRKTLYRITIDIAEIIGIIVDDVESIATFYTLNDRQPQAKKVINVCTSISRCLCNCQALVSLLENRLDIQHDETSADG